MIGARGYADLLSQHINKEDNILYVMADRVLTAAEQHLVKCLSTEKGRDLLKQVRTHLIETARPQMEDLVTQTTGVKVISLHHDISTVTGEEVLLFILDQPPRFRDSGAK